MLEEFYDECVMKFARPVATVSASESAATAAFRLSSNNPYGAVVVIADDQSKRLEGIITPYDLNKFDNPRRRPKTAADLATGARELVAVRWDAPLKNLLWIMNGENRRNRIVDRLPVVKDEGEVVGVITRSDLEQQLLEMHYNKTMNLAATTHTARL